MSDSIRIRRASATAEVDWTDERNAGFDEAVEKAALEAVRDRLAEFENLIPPIKTAVINGLHMKAIRLIDELQHTIEKI